MNMPTININATGNGNAIKAFRHHPRAVSGIFPGSPMDCFADHPLIRKEISFSGG